MNNYSVDRILAENTRTVLPECTFCKSRCWECIYFETDAPDSKGQCRCDFHGRWYYPTEGCGNGVSRHEPQSEPDPIPDPYDDDNGGSGGWGGNKGGFSNSNRTGGGSISSSTSTGNGGGSLILLIAGIALLFSMGLIKPTITFELDSNAITTEQYIEYSLNIVRMDDGSNSYPKNFKGYTAHSETLNDKGRSYIDLAKGGYDVWISHNGVSGFSGGVSVYNVFDKDVSIDTTNLESGAVNVALIRLHSSFGRKIVIENLKVEDGEGNLIPCTDYGEDGQYIVVIPDTQVDQGKVCVTIYAEGYETEEIELDFSKSRITEVKVKLTIE